MGIKEARGDALDTTLGSREKKPASREKRENRAGVTLHRAHPPSCTLRSGDRDELARERRLERRGRAEEDGADDLVVAREHIATREFTRRPSVSSLGVPNPNSDHPRRPRPQRDTSARVTSKPMRYLGRARSRARVPSPPRLLGLSTRHPRHRRDSPARHKGHIRLRRRARNAAKRTEPTHRVRRSRVRDTSIAVTRHTRPTLIMDRNARSCLAACAKPRRTETRGLSAARRDSRPGTPASLRPAPVMPISC